METPRESVEPHAPRAGSVPNVVDEGVFVTGHALERLREHHPRVGVRGALALLARAEEVPPGLAAAFLGRSKRGVQDRYFFSADRRGVFVVAPSWPLRFFPWVAVTYIRFGWYQTEVAERLLGAA